MGTGVSVVPSKVSISFRSRVWLAWTGVRAWFRSLTGAWFGEVLCFTAGEIK